MSVPKNNPSIKPMLPLLGVEGVDLIPLHQAHAIGQNGKKAGKRPLEGNWTHTDGLTKQRLAEYITDQHNIGVRLSRSVLVVDIDPRNFAEIGELDKQGNVLNHRPDRKLETDFGFSLDDYPTVDTGSRPEPGRHVYMRVPDGQIGDEQKLRKALEGVKGIDFKWFGGQVVAPGSVHPDSNELYEWSELTPSIADGIPDAPANLIEALVKPVSKQSLPDGYQYISPDALQQTLDTLNVEDFRDQEKWQDLMMACHAATQGEGDQEFIAWSTDDPEYAHAGSDIAYRWESLDADKPGGITYKSFLKIVDDNGGQIIGVAQGDFAEVDADDDTVLDQPENPLKSLNREYCMAMESGRPWIFSYQADDSLDRQVLTRTTPSDFRQFFANQRIQANGKTEPLGKAWLEWHARRSYERVAFMPEKPIGEYIDDRGKKVLNLWTGLAVEPKPGDWSYLQQLIKEAYCNTPKEYEYLLNWMAFTVQFPQLTPGVAIPLRGKKGVGKSTLASCMRRLFGSHSMQITSKDLLTGRFNLHLRDLVFLFADESFFAGDKDGEGRLKGLITESFLAFEGKGTNAVTGRNTLAIMMATNENWSVPATADERRFMPYDVKPIFKDNTAFFNALYDQMEKQGGLAAMLHDLLERDLSNFHPERDVPRNAALVEQILISESSLVRLAIIQMILAGGTDQYYRLEDGQLLIGNDQIEQLAFQAQRKYKGASFNRDTSEAKKFLETLLEGDEDGYRIHKSRPRIDGFQVNTSYLLPPLKNMRAGLARYYQCSVEELGADLDVEEWLNGA